MRNPTPPRWPDDYRNWSGSIKELADTAEEILRDLAPGIKPPNVRLLRYYQQSGVVGRGEKRGSQAIFGFEDLERVVAAKGLVKQNWTLDQAVSLMDSHPSPVSSLLYTDLRGGPPIPSATTPAAAAQQSVEGESSASSPPKGPQSAQDVVARLMAKSGTLSRASHSQAAATAFHTTPVASAQGLIFPAHSKGGVLRAAPSPSTSSPAADAPSAVPKPLLGVQAAPWMTVYLDEAAARRASPADRKLAIEALVSALRSLS